VGSLQEATLTSSKLTSATHTAKLMLSNVKPVPTWADKALSARYRELQEASKGSDPLRLHNAKRGVSRLRSKLGLT